MGEVLQIREFDAVTCADDNKTKYGYRLYKKHFGELMRFVKEYTSDDNNADALDFMKLSFKRNVGDIISFNNYVGMIQLPDGFQIEILPKIDFGENDDDFSKTKRIFLKMLRTMKDFEGKVFSESNLNVDRMNLYEIFINMYLGEVRQLVKKGIKSDYVSQEDNLNYFKGKLLVNSHIRVNTVHKERFFVAYDEFHPNRPENRLVKSTLLKLQKLTQSSENAKEIYRLLSFFEMVKPSTNHEKDFSKVVIDRNTKDYGMLMQWSKVFLLNKSFTTFSGSNDSKAILFPMESVYECYVARMLKKVMIPQGWDVSTQDKGYYLFEQPRKQFALRPDIVLYRGNRCVVLDTKWKALVDNPSANYGISQGDMYQMYAYSKKYSTSEIYLLYPMNKDFRGHNDIWFGSDLDGIMPTNVNLFFIDLADKKSIEELGSVISSMDLMAVDY
ncbi:McrC family protein [Oribacterium sp. FC2011]|uniref:McrC family protein n=1 Tax=Oribacterium sp. FC2011 TaxID=1408311 RepID=UPI0004E1B7D5|nr:McrC family protein [Oribacterium sp. FC2011]